MAVTYSECLVLGFCCCTRYCQNLKRKLKKLVPGMEMVTILSIYKGEEKRWNTHPDRQFSGTSLQPSSFIKPTPSPHHCQDYNAPFTLGVRANVQPKSSIPIEVALYWHQKLKNGTIELIWEANVQPLGPRF